MRTREERRENTKRKYLSRTKKIYNTYGKSLYDEESINDFRDQKWTKIIKDTPTDRTDYFGQYETKSKNRKSRKDKSSIREGLSEWDDQYSEFICEECVNFNTKECPNKGKVLNSTNGCSKFFS